MSQRDWYGKLIYHITPRGAWEAAQKVGRYRAPSLDTQGFIHASQREQIVKVANAVYAGQRDLVLLCVDPLRLDAALKIEPPDLTIPAEHHDGESFPHIYGEINVSAVLKTIDFSPEADGTFSLPRTLSGASTRG